MEEGAARDDAVEALVDLEVKCKTPDCNSLLADEGNSQEATRMEQQLLPPPAQCDLSFADDKLPEQLERLSSPENVALNLEVAPTSAHQGSLSKLSDANVSSLLSAPENFNASVEQNSSKPDDDGLMSETRSHSQQEMITVITMQASIPEENSSATHSNGSSGDMHRDILGGNGMNMIEISPKDDNMDREVAMQNEKFGSAGDANYPRDSRILFLEMELEKAQSIIKSRENCHSQENGNNPSLLVELQLELQEKFQNEEKRKLEAEERARIAEKRLEEMEAINQNQMQEINQLASATGNLQNQINARTEAENKARFATDRVQELERETTRRKYEIEEYEKMVVKLREKLVANEKERINLRDKYIEQERLQMCATSRLAIAKKIEADKACLAGKYEDLMMSALAEKDLAKIELQEIRRLQGTVEKELDNVKQSLAFHLDKASSQIDEERKLNDERKQKMKQFIESKTEEIRQAKEYNESLQLELSQTSKSLVDLNTRLNQLHNQWVQSQTRNRELQRDLNRIKKDSENLHKVGDTLEMKLSRSANETEEHKSKRLAAKQELMTVLRTLETERQITSLLKESFKFKLTPKVLNQQESLNDGLAEFEHQLLKLAIRLGKPSNSDSFNVCKPFQFTAGGDNGHQPDSDSIFLIAKLEHEIQGVSDIIKRFLTNVNSLRDLIDESGERTCFTVFNELLTSGSLVRAAATTPESTAPSSRIGLGRHRYGQLPADNDN